MEVVVSIAVLAVAITVIVGSIAYGSKGSAENHRKAKAVALAESVVSDIRAAINNGRAYTASPGNTTLVFGLTTPVRPATATSQTLYFNADGVKVASATGAFYKCAVNYYADATTGSPLTHANILFSWPVNSTVAGNQASVELNTSFVVP